MESLTNMENGGFRDLSGIEKMVLVIFLSSTTLLHQWTL